MKRIKYIVFVFLISIIGIGVASAASLSMSVSSKTITVGNSVKVTVTASGAAGWEYCLNYDSSYFKLTSGDKCIMGSTLAGNQKVTFTLKSLKSGSSTISLSTASMLDDNANELKFNKGSATITIKQQSDISNPKTDTPKSSNAYLRVLKVGDYDLSPAFKKDVYSYEVEVPNEVTEVGIDAFREDSTSTISTNVKDIDHIALNEGANKVEITVTAEKGNKLTYTINIKRKETDPVKVNISGKEYTVLRSLDGLTIPKFYVENKMEIDGKEVPSLTSDTTGYTLVALKDIEGNAAFYIVEGNTYTKYVEIMDDPLTLIPKDIVEYVKGYEQSKEIDINGNKVKVYYKDADSDFVLLYATNVSSGETSWYTYDIKDGTLQRYNETAVETEKESKGIYFYLAIGFAIIGGIAILIIFLVMGLNNRLRKRNEKLVKKLKEQKVKVIEHPVFDVDMDVDSWKDIKEPEDNGIDDEEFFKRDDEDTLTKINSDVEIKQEAFNNTQETEVPETKTKRKKKDKKKAKADKEKEEAELKAMRDDFMKTRELEITKEMKAAGEEKKEKKKTKKKKK